MKICDQTLRNQCDDSAVLIGVYLTETYNMFNRKDYGFRFIFVESFQGDMFRNSTIVKV